MKIKFVIAAALMLSLSAYAQKDELKALKKLDGKEQPTADDIKEYKRLLDEVEPKMGAATDEQKIDFHYYKGSYAMVEMMTNPAKAQAAFLSMKENYDKVLELEKKGKKKYTKEIQDETYPEVKQVLINLAEKITEQQSKEAYAIAGKYYYTAYQLVPSDAGNLYNAAAMTLNGGDYPTALNYYLELDKTGWTGEGKVFTAVNKQSGQVEPFPNQDTRDIAVKTGQYTTPSVQEFKSQKPQIARSIAELYIELKQNDKAKEAITAARKLNPDDVDLIVREADIYLKAGDTQGAERLINEAVAKQPNNPDLYLTLGSFNAESNPKQAEAYFKKAIAIKPDSFDAYVRLGDLMLVDEEKLTKQMNDLGNSAADNKKYAELKKQKEANYKTAVEYYEKAYNLQKDNQAVISMLTSLYQALEMTDKYNEFKAKKH